MLQVGEKGCLLLLLLVAAVLSILNIRCTVLPSSGTTGALLLLPSCAPLRTAMRPQRLLEDDCLLLQVHRGVHDSRCCV